MIVFIGSLSGWHSNAGKGSGNFFLKIDLTFVKVLVYTPRQILQSRRSRIL